MVLLLIVIGKFVVWAAIVKMFRYSLKTSIAVAAGLTQIGELSFVVVQAARLRDGSRRITHITEVMGLEGDVIITQDIFLYDILGEDANGNLIGRHRSTGIGRPRFWERARYFGEETRLAAALDASEVKAA